MKTHWAIFHTLEIVSNIHICHLYHICHIVTYVTPEYEILKEYMFYLFQFYIECNLFQLFGFHKYTYDQFEIFIIFIYLIELKKCAYPNIFLQNFWCDISGVF